MRATKELVDILKDVIGYINLDIIEDHKNKGDSRYNWNVPMRCTVGILISKLPSIDIKTVAYGGCWTRVYRRVERGECFNYDDSWMRALTLMGIESSKDIEYLEFAGGSYKEFQEEHEVPCIEMHPYRDVEQVVVFLSHLVERLEHELKITVEI